MDNTSYYINEASESLRLAVEVAAKRLRQSAVAPKLILSRIERVQPRPVPIVPCPDVHISYPLKP